LPSETRRKSGERKSPAGSRGRAPVGVCSDAPETGDEKYGCRLYRNTMKNTKHINTEINTMKT